MKKIGSADGATYQTSWNMQTLVNASIDTLPKLQAAYFAYANRAATITCFDSHRHSHNYCRKRLGHILFYTTGGPQGLPRQ